MGFRGISGGFKRTQSGFQGFSGGFMRSQMVFQGFRFLNGFRRIQRDFKGLSGDFHGVSREIREDEGTLRAVLRFVRRFHGVKGRL